MLQPWKPPRLALTALACSSFAEPLIPLLAPFLSSLYSFFKARRRKIRSLAEDFAPVQICQNGKLISLNASQAPIHSIRHSSGSLLISR